MTGPAPPQTPPRPFYGEFAWAYDYLIERPVADECAGMAAALARRGIGPGASLLDTGCWSRDELDGLLGAAGFEAMEYRGTYEGAPLGVGDRIVVAATRGAR